jgi:hypothetical protein
MLLKFFERSYKGFYLIFSIYFIFFFSFIFHQKKKNNFSFGSFKYKLIKIWNWVAGVLTRVPIWFWIGLIDFHGRMHLRINVICTTTGWMDDFISDLITDFFSAEIFYVCFNWRWFFLLAGVWGTLKASTVKTFIKKTKIPWSKKRSNNKIW